MRSSTISRRTWQAALMLVSLSLPSAADGITATLTGPYIRSITAGSYTVEHYQLGVGRSSGEVSFLEADGFAVIAADNRNLDFYFARSSTSPDWLVQFTSPWHDINGDSLDFFIFEVGGNDGVSVAPLLMDGTYGQDVSVSGWTGTGHITRLGPNNGQEVKGLGFKHTDLKYADGSRLAAGEQVRGLRMRSASLDAASLLFVDPDPQGGPGMDGDGSVDVVGETRVWQPFAINFSGPWATMTGESPDNPFLDRRLSVVFQGPSGGTHLVPGFFNGDGNGGGSGTVWTVRFSPDRAGVWTAEAYFREGPDVGISLLEGAGTPGFLEGANTTFLVSPPSPLAPGFLRRGHLQYAGGHYPRFEDGTYFIKGGANSPENFLAYRGFNSVADSGGIGILHDYAPHVQDWNPDDPQFAGDVHPIDGRGIIGAINYLSSRQVNSLFMMLMNLGGDGQDVHPFISASNDPYSKLHYDVGRLRQWNMVFEHAARKGIALHFGLAETEPQNETWLDGGLLGKERKLFYREMVARFAHNPAIKFTLCEENDYSTGLLRDFADYIRAQDPYGHAVTFHNHPDDLSQFLEVMGDERFEATSLQYSPDQAGAQVELLRRVSQVAGHPWAVQMDENNPWNVGLTDTNAPELRMRVLYDVLFSGGHIEWYAGWHQLPLGGDLTLEDFRTRDEMWRYMGHARRFLEQFVPFWQMLPADELLTGESPDFGGGEVFVLPGEVYAIYLPNASLGGQLSLPGYTGSVHLDWFNPRTGQFAGTTIPLQTSGAVNLDLPPSDTTQDWVIRARLRSTTVHTSFAGDQENLSLSAGGTQRLHLDAGEMNAGRTYLVLGTLSGNSPGFPVGPVHVGVNFDRYTRTTIHQYNQGILVRSRGVLDSNGQANAAVTFRAGTFRHLQGSVMHHVFILLDGSVDFASNIVSLRLDQ